MRCYGRSKGQRCEVCVVAKRKEHAAPAQGIKGNLFGFRKCREGVGDVEVGVSESCERITGGDGSTRISPRVIALVQYLEELRG